MADSDRTILHHDGRRWSAMVSGTTKPLAGVWGSSAQDVFAVGAAGTILRYDGVRWRAMASGTGELLTGVWGSPGGAVYVVGGKGTLLQRSLR